METPRALAISCTLKPRASLRDSATANQPRLPLIDRFKKRGFGHLLRRTVQRQGMGSNVTKGHSSESKAY